MTELNMTDHTTSLPTLVRTIIDGIQDKKGTDITVLDLSGIPTSPTLLFVVCTGRTPIQTAAIADSVRDKMLEAAGRKPQAVDGYRNREWLVIDYGEAVVHVMLPDTRTRYALEELWSDAVITQVPDLD